MNDQHASARSGVASGAGATMEKALKGLVRRLQQLGIGRKYRNGASAPGHNVLTPSRIAWANEMMRWVEEYVSQPHPDLGRKGPICPFMQQTVKVDRFLIALHDEVSGSSPSQIRDILLSHAEGLRRNFPETDPEGAFTGLVVVFPALAEEKYELLDALQDEMKTYLMASNDLMLTQCHSRCTKPSIHNPEFPVFRSPLPLFIMRHMDVRDIVFLGHNRAAFKRFRERFEGRFAAGKVSNEYGYVDMYNAARERFPD